MKHLHWIIADLFLPSHVLPQVSADLQLPYLEKLLARGARSTHSARTEEALLCKTFAADAVAPVRAQADGLFGEREYWLCADPVHLQLQQSQAVLQANLVCSDAEASALCASLNEHFNQDGLMFFAPHPQRWYVRVATLGDVTMSPLRTVTQRDVKAYLPQGADALRWQKVINETQMLLHGHPINVAREAKGLLTINSVWLWGGGAIKGLNTTLDTVGGDIGLSAAFAHVAKIKQAESLSEMWDGPAQQGLWLSTALNAAWRNDDLYAWREQIKTLEREFAQPMWKALCEGTLQSLTLESLNENSTYQFQLDRSACWKVWRRAKSLARHVS